MERRGWIVALGAVALIGVGVYIWWSDSSAQSQVASGSDQGETETGASGGSLGGGDNGAAATDADGNPTAPGAGHYGDGGVDRVAPHVDTPGPPRTGPNGLPPDRGQRRDVGANRSSGWRLGQTRARIEILEDLVQRYQTAYDGFVAAGNTESATRQRVTLDRVTGRLGNMRTQEAQLLEEAQEDGTMGDVETGLEEGEPTRVRVGAPSGGGTR